MAPLGFDRINRFGRRRRIGGLTDLVIAIGLIGLLAVVAGIFELKRLHDPDVVGLGTAIDGDSIRVGTDELRLEGIDAPEFAQTCADAAGREYACGRSARRGLSALLAQGVVRCTISGRDRYDRKLGHCHVGDQDINAALVRDGLAVAYGRYDSEQDAARAARRGLWAGQFQRPADYRQSHPRGMP